MNNQQKIELFLKQLQSLSQNNIINQKQIYAQLINYGIPESEQKKDISNIFNSLQENNKHNEQMGIFIEPNSSCFCRFISKDLSTIDHNNQINIHVPLKYQNLEKFIQKIFAFIIENNIQHCSKLSKIIRVDSLVIRVFNEKDANKIIEFVNNDEELTNNMYEPNPFYITEGEIGLSINKNLSYNEILAKYIYEYINSIDKETVLVSYNDFKQFLQNNLEELKSHKNIAEQIKMFDIKFYEKLPQFLQSLEEIIITIIKVLNGETKESLYEYYENIKEKETNEYDSFSYAEFISKNNELLKEIVSILTKKQGYNNAKRTLEKYKNTKDENYITRTNNAREKVLKSKTFITYLNIIDFEKEIEKLIPKTKEVKTKTSKEIILEEICKSTYLASQTPERKYSGKIQVAHALIKMQSEDFSSITRTNNARKQAQENIKPEEVKEIIEKTLEENGYIIENENDLYEIYATHIEHLCNNYETERRNT